MSDDYNPYMLDENHAHDMNHSRFELGQGKLRELQNNIAERRKKSEAMLAELGFPVLKRDPGYYEKKILLAQEYTANKEQYDAFINECLAMGPPDILLESIKRYLSKS